VRSFAKALPDFSFPGSATDAMTVIGLPRAVDGVTRSIVVDAVRDPSGNPMLPLATELVVHPVGDARERHDFDADVGLGMWGTAERVVDARCQTGGCIIFPAAAQKTCTPAGIAGLLTTKGRRTVAAKVRVASSTDINVLPPFSLAVVGFQGGAKSNVLINYEFAKTGTDPLPFRTPFKVLSVSSPSEVPEKIGFAIFRSSCNEALLPTATDAQVEAIVDDVSME